MAKYKLYILGLEDNCWYVGITERDVLTRFAEHDGRGDYPGASFCQEHPPLYGEPVFCKDISEWIAGHPDRSLSAKDRAEQLERRVTAQLLLLCGVNRVRGGGKDDLVAATDYDLGDVHQITENLVSALQLPYTAMFRHVSRMLADEDVGLFPDSEYYMLHQPEILYLDKEWNVVFNGQCIVQGALTVLARDLHPPSDAVVSDKRLLIPRATVDDSEEDGNTANEESASCDEQYSTSEEGDSTSDQEGSTSDEDESSSDENESTSDEDSSTSNEDDDDTDGSSSSDDDLSTGYTRHYFSPEVVLHAVETMSRAADGFRF